MKSRNRMESSLKGRGMNVVDAMAEALAVAHMETVKGTADSLGH
jgi:hypothetical protein